MAQGKDASPVVAYCPDSLVKSMGHSYTLPEDTLDLEFARAVLRRLAEQVARRLRAGKYRGRTVTLIVRYSDFSTFSLQKTFPVYTNSGEAIYRVTLLLMENKSAFQSWRAIRLIGVSVSHLRRGGKAFSFFEEERRKFRVTEAIDRINDKFGELTVFPAQLLVERKKKRPPRKSHGFLFKNATPLPTG